MFRRGSNCIAFALAVIAEVLLMGFGQTMAQQTNPGDTTIDAVRISPQEAYQQVKSGKALLVCAYDSEDKFRKMQLEGAISLSEFKSKLPSLTKDQEIVFYCA